MTKTYEKSVELDVPVSTAYNQWTQFEEFPRFMKGVESVEQLDDTTLRWKADIGGKDREWTAKITEQEPDMRIAWRNVDGPTNAGVVTFHKLDDAHSRVMVQMELEADDLIEKAGEALGLIGGRIEGDLERFKEFIESRGQETGAWRGRVEQN